MATKYTPMIEQYLSVKEGAKDAFFVLPARRFFYELFFFEDAVLASRELEITLTGKDGGAEERIPMCGVPYHSAETYIARLIEKGYKVAICEQVEDPAQAKGIVRREIVRIVTPGTVMDSRSLGEKSQQLHRVHHRAGRRLRLHGMRHFNRGAVRDGNRRIAPAGAGRDECVQSVGAGGGQRAFGESAASRGREGQASRADSLEFD